MVQTDLRQRLATALKRHQFWHANASSIGSNAHCLCGLRPRNQSEWADHVVADVLLSLDGIAIVELPAPDDIGGEDYNAWWAHYPNNDPHQPARWPNYDVTAFDGHCGYGTGGQFMPSEARAFAAALLAAADKAEERK